MPPPSKRKRQRQEVETYHVELDLLMDGYGGSEIGEGEVDDHKEMYVIETEREAVINLERDPQLDLRAVTARRKIKETKRPNRSVRLQSVSNIRSSSTFSSSGACFLCRRRADCNVTENRHQAHRLQLMQVNMFKDTVQEVLGNSYSLSSSSDTCAECNEVVDKVWRLQQEILLIKEDLKTIIEETVKNIRSRSRERRLSENDSSDNADANDFLDISGESLDESHVKVVKEEPIDSYLETDNEDLSSFVIQGDADDKKAEDSDSSRKRKSRIKAEEFLRKASKDEESQVESDDDANVSLEEYSSDSEFENKSTPKPTPTSSRSPSTSAPSDFRCDKCHATFKTSRYRQRHIMRVHEKHRPFPCTLCEKRFFRADEVTNHVFIYHTPACDKEQRLAYHRCEIVGCLKKFSNKTDLQRHVIAHNGLEAFICSKCGSSFSQAASFKKHVRQVDCTRDGYKPPCRKQSILKRIRACSLCPLKCMTIEGLAHHQKSVHDIDPPPGVNMVEEPTTTCDICLITIDKSHLRRHTERVHENIKNKSCPHCDKMFYNTSGVNTHIRRHHQEKIISSQDQSQS